MTAPKKPSSSKKRSPSKKTKGRTFDLPAFVCAKEGDEWKIDMIDNRILENVKENATVAESPPGGWVAWKAPDGSSTAVPNRGNEYHMFDKHENLTENGLYVRRYYFDSIKQHEIVRRVTTVTNDGKSTNEEVYFVNKCENRVNPLSISASTFFGPIPE